MQRSALCRSRRELSNAYFLAKFGFDTADNESFQVCPLSAYRSPRFATFASQRRFEKEVHEKVSKLGNLSDAEAVLVDDCLILVRDFGDTNIIIVANPCCLASFARMPSGTRKILRGACLGQIVAFRRLHDGVVQ